MTGAVRAVVILSLLLTANCTPVQDTHLQVRADRLGWRAERAERARRQARLASSRTSREAALPKPPGSPEAGEAGWTRLHCEDGRRFAIRVPRQRGGGAQVRVDDSQEVETFDNLHGQVGNHYGKLPGYSIHQSGREWSYMDGSSVLPRPVPCRREG